MIDNLKAGVDWSEMYNDPRGGLWLAAKEGWYLPNQVLYRLDIEMQRNRVSCTPGMANGICVIPGLTEQFNSQYALSSFDQYFATRWGLLKFNGSSWQSFTTPKTLLSNLIYSLGTSPSGETYLSAEMTAQKTDGIMWTQTGGVQWLNPPIRFHTDGSLWDDGINGNYATGLDIDTYSAYWAAYGSIMTMGANGFKQWLPKDIGMERPSQYYSPQFMDIAIDRNDNVWATGWYNGTVMYDRTTWHLYYESDTTLPNDEYDRIFTDSKGRVWFGSWGMPNYGFSMYDGLQWRTFYSDQRPFIVFVYQFAEDQFGNVWIATQDGLLKYDGTAFTIYDASNSLLNTNIINAVSVDFANNLWVGTNSGLFIYNPAGRSSDHIRIALRSIPLYR